jgi:hypothetical protein
VGGFRWARLGEGVPLPRGPSTVLFSTPIQLMRSQTVKLQEEIFNKGFFVISNDSYV